MSKHEGMVWVRDKKTGNRHRWPEAKAKTNPDLEILKTPVTTNLPVRPTPKNSPAAGGQASASATADSAAESTEAVKEATS